MDNWDELLERSIAARMEAVEAETEAATRYLVGEKATAATRRLSGTESGAATRRMTDSGPAPRDKAPSSGRKGEVYDFFSEDNLEDTDPAEADLWDFPLINRSTVRTEPTERTEEIRTVTLTLGDKEPAPKEDRGASPAPGGSTRRQRNRSRGEKSGTGSRPHKEAAAKKQPPDRRAVSLQARWLWNSMGAVGLLMVVICALAIILLCNYFYSTMQSGLESRVQTAAGFFANYQTESEYLEHASGYVSNFDEADAIELEFIDTTGEIIYSSYAYQQTSGVTPGTRDVVQALENATLTCWIGKDPFTGERIMAVSAPVVQNGTVRGVIRMVTSTSAVDRQLVALSALLVLLLAAILLLIYSTNRYFVKSIAEPIAAITESTKRIAAGSYGVQIEKKYNDEIGELVDTINDMSIRIGQAEKVKSEFISSVSHELRTPLTAINGWGETLIHGDVTDPRDLHKGLAIIVSEARRLTKMVEELLEFSRIEDGRFTLRIEQLDIKAELEDAVYAYREFFRKKGIALEYRDCEEEFPPIPGDPERLRQVFSNLLDNAAKHGGSGKQIDVSIAPRGQQVAIKIRDYGHGIPPEELPLVKTKFYKGSSKARGSGIGLAVCDEIAQRHNGSLDIANAMGGGCVVTLCLPLHE